MKISALYDKTPSTGYGRMAAEIVNALEGMGIEVVDYNEKDKNPYVLFMVPPHRPEGWWKGQQTILLTMWESTELALEHLTTVPLFDTVLVPSDQNLEIFGAIHPNTKRFSLGANYDQWHFTERPKTEPFTVLTSGKGGRRKGIDISIKVFKRFRDEIVKRGYPHPRLIIKSGVTLGNPDPDIVLLDGEVSAEEEIKIFEQAHVYLGLARGEGWGMIPHQAIAQGIPTILSNAHGHKGFSQYGLRVSCGYIKAETEIVGRSGDWWEPNEDEAYETLLDVFLHYADYADIAEFNAYKIEEDLTWEKTAEQIVAALKPEQEVTDEWIVCPQIYLELKVTQPIDCSIAGTTFNFRPGNSYSVTADVKRVIYDSGMLDPACIDPAELAHYKALPAARPIDEGIPA